MVRRAREGMTSSTPPEDRPAAGVSEPTEAVEAATEPSRRLRPGRATRQQSPDPVGARRAAAAAAAVVLLMGVAILVFLAFAQSTP